MSITAIKGQRGEEQAFCTCDDCGGESTVSARHGDGNKQARGGRIPLTIHSEASVIESLRKLGWSHVKSRLRCPKCTEARAQKQQEASLKEAAATPARIPSKEQKRLIILALEDAYDSKAQRYREKATDRTVADELGQGIMPGWVAALRDEFFGPAGNEEAEAIRALVADYETAVRKETSKLRDQIAKIETDALEVAAGMRRKLNALYGAEDKRVKA